MPASVLHWIGHPRVEIDGQSVSLETRKITALVALISVDLRPHSRERLSAIFWPDFDSERAPANLRRALASLQKTPLSGWLSVDRDTVEFKQDVRLLVDFNDFIGTIRKTRDSLAEPGAPLTVESAEVLRSALAFCTGDFLEGFNLKDCPEFDQWQTLKREELFQHQSWALERMVEFYSENGKWEDAIGEARRWLSLDDLNESAHRTLMFLFARTGKRSAALKQYEICRRLLRRELGQDPDEQTSALAERIRLRKIGASPPDIDRFWGAESDITGNAVGDASGNACGFSATGLADTDRVPPPAGVRGSVPSGSTAASETRPERAAFQEPFLTRLAPPQIRASRVERPRLFSLLDMGASHAVTLVSAPAGFGKTTLIGEWVQGCGIPAAWISFEENDDSPRRFIAAVASALGKRFPGIGSDALDMLRSMQVPPLPKIVESVLNDLERYPAPRLLVLDDFHLIRGAESQELFALLVDNLPADLRLLVATRADPPIPLARLRARDRLAEIRADDLRFSEAEAGLFLRKVMGLELGDKEIRILEQRTEGWAAGLQMAALSLRGRQDPSPFIRDFGGSHRYIMDYLVGEVLEGLPPDAQEFLLRTSVLRRFRAELCDAMMERPNSYPILESLDRGNIFLVALDEKRVWYRYHHLFAELLRHRLNLTRGTDEMDALHIRAGHWWEKAEEIEEAMYHYLAGRNYREALRVITERHDEVMTAGGLGTLVAWVSAIPPKEEEHDPAACISLGSVLAFAGRGEDADRHLIHADELLDAAERNLSPTEEGMHEIHRLRGESAAIRSFVADVAGRSAAATEFAKKAIGILPPDAAMARSLAYYVLSKDFIAKEDYDGADACSLEHVRLARSVNNIWSLAGAIHFRFSLCRVRGRLGEARRILEESEAELHAPGSAGPVALVLADRAEMERERGLLDKAAATVDRAVRDVNVWGLPSDVAGCLLTRVRISLSLGRIEAAAEDMGRIDELVRSSLVYASIFPSIEAERVRVLMAEGRTADVNAWLENRLYSETRRRTPNELTLIAEARTLLFAGRCAEARELLDRIAPAAESAGRFGRLIEILVLKGAACSDDAADEALRRALLLAEQEGYAQIFLDEGEAVTRRLKKISDNPVPLPPHLADYLREILSRN